MLSIILTLLFLWLAFKHMKFLLVAVFGLIIFSMATYPGPAANNTKEEWDFPEDGGDGVYLKNNLSAQPAPLAEVEAFLLSDSSEYHKYNKTSYSCCDYAESVHNNAEKAGLQCGYVKIRYVDTLDGHVVNCFNTTNAGIVYIDSTGGGSVPLDTYVNLEVGEPLKHTPLKEGYTVFDDRHIVRSLDIYW